MPLESFSDGQSGRIFELRFSTTLQTHLHHKHESILKREANERPPGTCLRKQQGVDPFLPRSDAYNICIAAIDGYHL
jgi:hypothetical protein